MNEQITGALFKQMVLHGAASITAQKQAINDLNVFPVPEGDTGTKMSMTISTAVTELRKAEALGETPASSSRFSFAAFPRGSRGWSPLTQPPSPPPCRRVSPPPTRPS